MKGEICYKASFLDNGCCLKLWGRMADRLLTKPMQLHSNHQLTHAPYWSSIQSLFVLDMDFMDSFSKTHIHINTWIDNRQLKLLCISQPNGTHWGLITSPFKSIKLEELGALHNTANQFINEPPGGVRVMTCYDLQCEKSTRKFHVEIKSCSSIAVIYTLRKMSIFSH